MKIKRYDPIYLEIENFKDYELTNNIAFEMAIRNEEVLQDMKLDIENDTIENIAEDGFEYPFIGLYKERSLKISDNYRLKLKQFSEDREYKKSSLGDHKSDITTANVCFFSGMEIDAIKEVKIKNNITDLQLEQLIKELQIDVETPGVLRSKVIEANEGENLELVLLAKQYPEYFEIAEHGIDESFLIGSTIEASLNMSRPLMRLNEVAKNVQMTFNMALSNRELIAQLLTIKKEFDKHFHKIKSQEELLGVKLELSDTRITNHRGKRIDPEGTLQKTQKVADMFFIYDCIQAGMAKQDIQYEIHEYYATGGGSKLLSDKTFYKFRDIAIKYIDEYGYKELLSGVKMPVEFFS
jgi:hypothetical protein